MHELGRYLGAVLTTLNVALVLLVVPVAIMEKMRRGCTPAVQLLFGVSLFSFASTMRYGLDLIGVEIPTAIVVTRTLLIVAVIIMLRALWFHQYKTNDVNGWDN